MATAPMPPMVPQVNHPRLPMIIAIGITAIIFGLGGYVIASMANTDTSTDATVKTGTTATATTSATPTTKTTATATASTSSTSNVFDATKAKVGDKIVGMTITSIKPWRSKGSISNDSVEVQFSGQATVTGIVENYTNDLGLGCVDITNLDASSKSKLPQLQGDDRQGFCLTGDTADKEFPVGTKWQATIVISDYFIDMAGAEVRNSGKLVSVTTKTKL